MKNVSTRRKLNKKTILLGITLSLVILIALVPIAYAVFTGYAFAQRTIGAYDQFADVFTSNYLLCKDLCQAPL